MGMARLMSKAWSRSATRMPERENFDYGFIEGHRVAQVMLAQTEQDAVETGNGSMGNNFTGIWKFLIE